MQITSFLILLSLLLGNTLASSTDNSPDVSFPDILLERVAFKSCNKQFGRDEEQSQVWRNVAAFQPQLWLWTGDAVYAKNHSLTSLAEAYDVQTSKQPYQEFLSGIQPAVNATEGRHGGRERKATGVMIDGIWDDHDLGINDGGRGVPEMDARKRAFVDFLAGASSDDTSGTHQTLRLSRPGLYRSLTFGNGSKRVRIILLDTRSFRDPHRVPSVGAVGRGVPLLGRLTPLAAAVSRWASLTAPSLLDFFSWLGGNGGGSGAETTYEFAGDMLGEEQWAWLEGQLSNQDGDDNVGASTPEKTEEHADRDEGGISFNIIVSSVQVLTSAPVFESWAHFPKSKRRLLSLLQKYRPRGLVLLSGDVHFAELSATPDNAGGASNDEEEVSEPHSAVASVPPPPPTVDSVEDGDGEDVSSSIEEEEGCYDAGEVSCGRVAEVTSSGLTHTCVTSGFITRSTCHPVLVSYAGHRLNPPLAVSSLPGPNRSPPGTFTGLNFGTLAIDWGSPQGTNRSTAESKGSCQAPTPLLTVAVRNAATGKEVLKLSRRPCSLDIL